MQCEFEESCSLHTQCETPRIRIEGRPNPDVLVIGDCPHESDDKCGGVLVGEAGELLRLALVGNGFSANKIAYTYVVKCRPTQRKWNKTLNREPTDKEVKTCKPYLLAEIEVYKPKIILLLGGVALKAVLGETGITSKRGRIFDYEGIPVVPTLNPEVVVKDDTYLNPFLKDLETLYKEFTGTMPTEEQPVNYVFCDTKKKLDDLLDYASDQEEVAVDTEDSCLNPFKEGAQIVCCQFSFKEYESYVIPIYNKEMVFTGKMLEYAKTVMKLICESDIRKILQNAKFDLMWFEIAEGIRLNNIVSDIMMKSYLLNELSGTHALDYLVWQFCPEMGSYWEGLERYKAQHKDCDPERGGSYRNIPWKVLIPYAAADTDASIRIDHKISPLLSNREETV